MLARWWAPLRAKDIPYLIGMEPRVQMLEETLARASSLCPLGPGCPRNHCGWAASRRR